MVTSHDVLHSVGLFLHNPNLYNVYYKEGYTVMVILCWNDTLMYWERVPLRSRPRLLLLGVLVQPEDSIRDLPRCVRQCTGAHTKKSSRSFYIFLNMACSIYTKCVHDVVTTDCHLSSRGKGLRDTAVLCVLRNTSERVCCLREALVFQAGTTKNVSLS